MNDNAVVGAGGERRLAYVDGLRAVAVLAVIAHHVVRYMPALASVTYVNNVIPPTALARFGRFFIEGSHGVDLFFVISGFCLAYPSLARLHVAGETRFDLAHFATKRMLRIVPPYEIALAVFALAAIVARSRGLALPLPMPQHAFDAGSLVMQALLLDRNVDFLTGSFWTLAVELRWYFLFPAALALYVRAPRAFALLVVAAVIAYDFTRLHAIDIAVLPAFLSGIVAADWARRGNPFGSRLWLAVPFALLAAFLLEPSAVVPSSIGNIDAHALYVQSNHGWQLVCFLAVVLAGETPLVRRILATPALVSIGVAGYAIYLVHEPIVALVQPAVRGALGDIGAGLASALLALTAGLVFSALVERPLLRVTSGRGAAAYRILTTAFRRGFHFAGLPVTFSLQRPPQVALELEPVGTPLPETPERTPIGTPRAT